MTSLEAGSETSESPQVAQATSSSAYSSIESQIDILLARSEASFSICEQRCSTATEIIDKVNSGDTASADSTHVPEALANWYVARHEQYLDNDALLSFVARHVEAIIKNEVISAVLQRVAGRFKAWTLAKIATEVALGEALVRHKSCSPVPESEREKVQEQVRDMELGIQKRQMSLQIDLQAMELLLGARECLVDPDPQKYTAFLATAQLWQTSCYRT